MNNQKTNVNVNNDNDIVTMARFSEDGRWYLAQIWDIKYTHNKQTNANSNADKNVENKDDIDEEVLVFVSFTEYGNCEWIDLLDVKLPEK